MINFTIIYLSSYFLTYFGCILKKDESIKEELPELRKPIKHTIDILLAITYFTLIYIFSNNPIIITTTIILMILKLISIKQKNYTKELHNLLLFGTTLIFTFKFNFSYIYLSLLPVFILFFEQTLSKKFDKKKEAYNFLIIIIILILFNTL